MKMMKLPLKEQEIVAVLEIDALNLENEVSNVLKPIIQAQIKPNVFFDKEKTDEKIQEVQKNISKVIIKTKSNYSKRRRTCNSKSNRYFIRLRNVK